MGQKSQQSSKLFKNPNDLIKDSKKVHLNDFVPGRDPTTKITKFLNKELKQLREQEENLLAI